MSVEFSQFEAGQTLDLSNLNLEMEAPVDEVNPEANMEDTPPPVDDGEWSAVPVLVANEDGSFVKLQKGDEKGPHPALAIDWVLRDPRLEGTIHFDSKIRVWPSTRVGYNQTSEIDQLLKCYTGKSGAGMSRLQKVAAVIPFLQASTPLAIQTQWTAETPDPKDTSGKKTVVIRRGQKSFPKIGNSEKHNHIITDDRYPGADIVTRAKIKTYRPLT